MNDPAPGHRLVPSGVTRISFSNDDHHDEHEHQKHDTCVDDPSCGAPPNAGTTRTIDALSELVGRWVLSTKRPWLLGFVVLQGYCATAQFRVGLFHAKRRVLEHPPFLIHHGKIGAFNDRLHQS
jgi:hypothetical protein